MGTDLEPLCFAMSPPMAISLSSGEIVPIFSATYGPVLPCSPNGVSPQTLTIILMVLSPPVCRSIRCLRNIIHWNLITAFILRNATWFVVQFTMNPEVQESNGVGAAQPWGMWGAQGSQRQGQKKHLGRSDRVAWWLKDNESLWESQVQLLC